jgi:hypothetical protein
VPVYGRVSVLSSTIVPVPLMVNGHETPLSVAVPETVIGTVVPWSSPDALPEMVTPPPQVAENVPAIAVDVWLEIVHCRFVQEPGDGAVAELADAHVPR